MVKYEGEEDDLETAVKSVVNLIRVATRDIDKVVAKTIPQELSEPTQHFIKANIEFLTAVRGFLDKRIEGLEKTRKSLEERSQKRKVKREEVHID